MRIVVEEGGSGPWTLSLRIPAWSEATRIGLPGKPVEPAPVENGYARIARAWQAGDVVELDLAMTPRLTEGHPWIESTRGCVAIERGPLVYCLEQIDQQAPVYDLEIDPSAAAHGVMAAGPAGRRHGGARSRLQDRPVGLGGAAVSPLPGRRARPRSSRSS